MKHLPVLFMVVFFLSSSYAQINVTWKHLGPDNLGGWVLAFLIDNRDPQRNTLYAAPSGGGLFKSTDKGDSWFRLPCLINQTISSITQANDGTIYVATGFSNECNSIGDGGLPGLGAVKSDGIFKLDANDNVFLLNSTRSNDNFRCTGAIEVNPINSQQLFAATNYGFLVSNNSGQNWDTIVTGNFTRSRIKFSKDGKFAYASLGRVASTARVFWYAQSRGTWLRLNPTDNPGFAIFSTAFTSIAFAPNNSSFAVLQGSASQIDFGRELGVVKTEDGGQTWDTIVTSKSSYRPFPGYEGWLHNVVAVIGTTGDSLIFGGSKLYGYTKSNGLLPHSTFDYLPNQNQSIFYPQEIFVNDKNYNEVYITTSTGLFRSFNAVKNFPTPYYVSCNKNLSASHIQSFYPAFSGEQVSVTIDDIWLAKSYPNSKSFFIDGSLSGIYATAISHIDESTSFKAFYQGVKFLRRRTTGGSWAEGYNSQMRANISSNQCRGQFYFKFFLAETISADKGRDSVSYKALQSKNVGDTIQPTSKIGNYKFVHTLQNNISSGVTINVCDKVKSRVFLPLNCGLFFSDNSLHTDTVMRWYRLSGNTQVRFVDWSEDVDTIHYFTSSRKLFRITGLNFLDYSTVSSSNDTLFKNPTQLTFPFTGSERNPEALAMDKNNANHFIICASQNSITKVQNNLFKTEDGGQTWEPFQVGPVGLSIFSCLIDKHNNNRYALGTESGIWISEDRGYNWFQTNEELCETTVLDLKQLPVQDWNCNAIYAATTSTGVWRTFSFTPQGCNTKVGISEQEHNKSNQIMKIYPNPASSSVNVVFEEDINDDFEFACFTTDGRKTLLNWIKKSSNMFELDVSKLPQGFYIFTTTSKGVSIQAKLMIGR